MHIHIHTQGGHSLRNHRIQGKVRGKNSAEKFREIHGKTVKVGESKGKMKFFYKCLRKCCDHAFYFPILSKDKSYGCYFWP